MRGTSDPGIAPVEYAVAVERYLAESRLSQASRRIYRIALTSWAWPLTGQLPPSGAGRRNASPPVVPLAILDDPQVRPRLADAVAHRTAQAGPRTVNRELSALRSAVAWWLGRGWISADPTASFGQLARPATGQQPLGPADLAALFAIPAPLREQAFWHLLHDSGASAQTVLGLGAQAVHGAAREVRIEGAWVPVSQGTARLLGWLLAGRRDGPVFLTDRRAPAGTRASDTCPLTGRGRMSYRRAAEIFTETTRQLDPAGRGWTLHQLRPPDAATRL